MIIGSEAIQNYFKQINEELEKAYSVARKARALGYDPENDVDIPLAKNMAERVEGLISVVAPQLVGSGMTEAISDLEKEYSALDWRVGFRIAEEVAKEKFCKFESKKEAMEVGIRTGFAYLTCGIVSAPLEGFIELKIKKRRDGKEYFALQYAGPIRGAGGTAAATSVVLADYIRVKMGYAAYDPDEKEVMRYLTEIYNYHERAVNLQYLPSIEELKFLVTHIPVEISGDPTEALEVSNYKDLDRVETNRIRGGMCLVLAEGIAQKSPKLWKRLKKWGKEFSLDWKFIEEFITLQKRIKSKSKSNEKIEKNRITPNLTFIADLVAGRPVLTYPLAKGGFRLRYGRSRVSGFSAASVHPNTMHIVNRFVATGTQLKIERPGKAAAITPCDSIEAQLVKLKNGSVVYISTEEKFRQHKDEIDEVLFLGDILINYGDFSENNHVLVPAGYCEEWWQQEFEQAIKNKFSKVDYGQLSVFLNIDELSLVEFLTKTVHHLMTFSIASKLSELFEIPLHPKYTFHWKLISVTELNILVIGLGKLITQIEKNESGLIQKIVIKNDAPIKLVLEQIGVPHLLVNHEFIVLEKDHGAALISQLGNLDKETIKLVKEGMIRADQGRKKEENYFDYMLPENTALITVQEISEFKLRDKSGTFIGARMGRPEKAKQRKLTGSPQVLFPVGEEGGRLRSFQQAIKSGKIRSLFSIYRCKTCKHETVYKRCETCDKETKKIYYCKTCGLNEEEKCKQHGNCSPYTLWEVDAAHYFKSALSKINDGIYPELIRGVKGTSNKDHIPENLIKGVLRAKHNIYVNKDGTTRFDMSELPITHFKPKEISVSIEKLNQLGYFKDIDGNVLVDRDQVLELRPQDIILPATKEALDDQADIVLLNIGKFVDELLVKLYKDKPFYNFKSRDDLIGHLVIGIAPHISAGVVGRIIGFSDTQVFFAHPLFHAAMRRDADGDEAGIILLMDGLLNFSREYLPNRRGSKTMDSPLVLTSYVVPSEVDDQVLGIDIQKRYPLEFYEATFQHKYPYEVKIKQVKDVLDTEGQYEGIGYTHDVSSINLGVKCSAYKSLPSMEEKLNGQLEIGRLIRAVNVNEVARLVIEKHFMKDTKGNLRRFSNQSFRCTKCNEKYRRPPLIGQCLNCHGKLIFTVPEGSVIKYLNYSINLSKEYEVPEYLRQCIELLRRRIQDNFIKEKEKQEGLVKWT
jgi:DNA polymerase II large subunit